LEEMNIIADARVKIAL